jgi:N-acylneuraminate cytidylyltransferase
MKIALLPMKGHSERVPGKNIKILNGKPLFFHIADTLKKSNLFHNLVINTDSEEIANLAIERYNNWVLINKRPIELQGDYVSMNSIIEYDLSQIDSDCIFFQTHSTNPLLTIDTIKNALDKFENLKQVQNIDSIFSVNLIKTRLYNKNLVPLNHNPENLQRTQDLADIYEENSNFYIFTKDSFKKNNRRIGINPDIFIMGRNTIESLDIDDKSDWDLVEKIISKI